MGENDKELVVLDEDKVSESFSKMLNSNEIVLCSDEPFNNHKVKIGSKVLFKGVILIINEIKGINPFYAFCNLA